MCVAEGEARPPLSEDESAAPGAVSGGQSDVSAISPAPITSVTSITPLSAFPAATVTVVLTARPTELTSRLRTGFG